MKSSWGRSVPGTEQSDQGNSSGTMSSLARLAQQTSSNTLSAAQVVSSSRSGTTTSTLSRYVEEEEMERKRLEQEEEERLAAEEMYRKEVEEDERAGREFAELTSQALKEFSGASTLESVRINGLTLLKIVKHASQSYPDIVQGSLLGVDIDGYLDVTHSFPLPMLSQSLDSATSSAQQEGGYEQEQQAQNNQRLTKAEQEEEMEALRVKMTALLAEVHVDNNCVGWYRTSNMGNYSSMEVIQKQFDMQEKLDYRTGRAKCVMLIYDPVQSSRGQLAIKAVRLSDKFMNLYRTKKQNNNNHNNNSNNNNSSSIKDSKLPGLEVLKLGSDEIFVEIPIEISNPLIVQCFLSSLKDASDIEASRRRVTAMASFSRGTIDDEQKANDANTSGFDVDFDRFDLSKNSYLESSLQGLVSELGYAQSEFTKMQNYQRQAAKQRAAFDKWLIQRKAENVLRAERGEPPLPEVDPVAFPPLKTPSRWEILSNRHQIGVYCDQANDYASSSLGKLYLLNALNQ